MNSAAVPASPTAPVSAHAHGHHHAHSHDHGHEHHHGHDHETGRVAPFRVHSRPDAPHFSLMRLSAAQRLGGAGGLIVLLWACVWWAMQ